MKKLVLVAVLAMVVMAVSFGSVFAQAEVIGDNNDKNIVLDLAADIAANVTVNAINNSPNQIATVEGDDVVVNQKMVSNVNACAQGVAATDGAAVAGAGGGAGIVGDNNDDNVVVEGDAAIAINLTGNIVNNSPTQVADVSGDDVVVNQEMESNVNVKACGVATVGNVCVDLGDCCCDVCEVVCEEVKCCEVVTTVPKTGDVASLASVVALVVSGLGATVVGRKIK
ncbi:MAG: hypothetical protein GX127_09120 [Eubacteriaceae bacterium]|jgi:hypothetical protein|nr:hypothetical protein [Eubacteriaceae bacterium]